MDILNIASNVANCEICPACKTPILYDDGVDSYQCNCGPGCCDTADPVVVINVASRIAKDAPVISKITCGSDISLSVDFDGAIGEAALMKKLKTEIISAIRSAVSITAREMRLKATKVELHTMNVTIE